MHDSQTIVDPKVTIEEHPHTDPVSYMAHSNLVALNHDVQELQEMINSCDDLPQWVDQLISEATDRIAKAKRYIMSEKTISEPEVHMIQIARRLSSR